MCLVALTAGCAEIDPYRREGMWQPEGINSRNLAAMVIRPADLLRGQGDAGATGQTSTAAVIRLFSDTPRQLPALSPGVAPGANGTGLAGGAPGAAASAGVN